VTWGLTVPGQPLSWNAAYRIGVKNRPGGRGSYRTIIKTDDAVAYTDMVAMLAKVARPSGWHPEGLIVVEYRLYLGRNVDSDNVMKLIGDGLQGGTGISDEWFLPRAMSKEWGLRPEHRRVELSLWALSESQSPPPPAST
jgi:hypothetical protein